MIQILVQLFAAFVVAQAVEDPDLIKNCGDAKALALGIPPSGGYAHVGHAGGYSHLGYGAHGAGIVYAAPKVSAYVNPIVSSYAADHSSKAYSSYNHAASAYTVGNAHAYVTAAPAVAKVVAAPVPVKVVSNHVAPSISSYSSGISHSGYSHGAHYSLDNHNSYGLAYGAPAKIAVTAAPIIKYASAPVASYGYAGHAGVGAYSTYSAPAYAKVSTHYSGLGAGHASGHLYGAHAAPAVAVKIAPAPLITKSYEVTDASSAHGAHAYSSGKSFVSYAAPAVAHVAHAPAPIAVHAAPAVVSTGYLSGHASHAAPAVVSTGYLSSGHASHAGNYYGHGKAYSYAAPAVSVAPVVKYAAAPAIVSAAPVHNYVTPGHVVKAPAAVAVKPVAVKHDEYYDAHPQYTFEYGVNDPHTGDIKEQKEHRDGDVVNGHYALVEPDGNVRTVQYTADWETGFHAKVTNSKHSTHTH